MRIPARIVSTEPAADLHDGASGRAARSRALRIRYAILGAVLAGLWVGHSGEPAWEHALRTVAVLLTIRPLLWVTLRYRLRQARAGASTSDYLTWLIAMRLAVVAGALGVSWLIGYLLDPAHRHWGVHTLLLRLLVLALTIPLQVRAQRRYRGGRGGPQARLLWGRLITAKIGLILAALGAEVLLQRWLGGSADLLVAAGLFAVVALLGPWAHRRYLTSAGLPRRRWRRPARPHREPEPASART